MLSRTVLVVLLLACVAGSCASQSLTNLGFELGVVEPNDPMFGWLDWSVAVPGWSHTPGDDTGIVYYGYSHIGVTQWFMLVDANNPSYRPLSGRYSMALMSGFYDMGMTEWVNAAISQRGLIPSYARSIRFMATGNVGITVNGSHRNVVSVGPNTYAADVSGFAGSVCDLAFVDRNTSFEWWTNGPSMVDSISFSTTPVIPEPSSLIALGGGLISLLGLARRRR